MRRSQLQHRAVNHVVFTRGLFGFSGEALQRGSEILDRFLLVILGLSLRLGLVLCLGLGLRSRFLFGMLACGVGLLFG